MVRRNAHEQAAGNLNHSVAVMSSPASGGHSSPRNMQLGEEADFLSADYAWGVAADVAGAL